MANKHRGEVALQLDKKRKLKFNTNALVELEEALGKPFSQLSEDNMGFSIVAKMFWASLLHECPELSLQKAYEIMDHGDFTLVSEKVMEAFALAFPTSNDAEKKVQVGPNGAGPS